MTTKHYQHISHALYNKNIFLFCVFMFWCLWMSQYSSVQRSWEGLLWLLFCYLPILPSFPVSSSYHFFHVPFSFRSPSSITTGLHFKQNSSWNFSPTVSRLSLITSFQSRPPSAVDNLLAAIAPRDPPHAASWYWCNLDTDVVWCEGESQTREGDE